MATLATGTEAIVDPLDVSTVTAVAKSCQE